MTPTDPATGQPVPAPPATPASTPSPAGAAAPAPPAAAPAAPPSPAAAVAAPAAAPAPPAVSAPVDPAAGPEVILTTPGIPTSPADAPPRRTPKVRELEAILERHAGRNLLVFLKGTPDPDSIASAWALKYIARAFDVDCTILYTDKLSHQENRALVKSMEIPMVFFTERFDFSRYSGYAIVDFPSGGLAELSDTLDEPARDIVRNLPLIILIDHHKTDGNVVAEFMDIRENSGSTSSICAEYLREGRVKLEAGVQETTQLATALMHGIRSDTDGFFIAREIDYAAASFLCQYADSDLLKVISAQPIPAKAMDILYKALANKTIRENYIMAGVGYVRSEDRDGIPQAADFLLRREGIDTVIVFGILDEKYIEGSLRTRSRVLDPDQFLKEILGQDGEGKPYGGGRLDKGGFKIPVGMFAGCTDKKLLWEMTTRTLTDIFFKALGIAAQESE